MRYDIYIYIYIYIYVIRRIRVKMNLEFSLLFFKFSSIFHENPPMCTYRRTDRQYDDDLDNFKPSGAFVTATGYDLYS